MPRVPKRYRVTARCYVQVELDVATTSKVKAKAMFEDADPALWRRVTFPHDPHCIEVADLSKEGRDNG
jgi:hypothetical protein